MDAELSNCTECGRPFTPRGFEVMCPACDEEHERIIIMIEDAVERHDKKTPREIAEHTGLELRTVKKMIQASRVLAHATEPVEVCVHCRKRKPLPASMYCLICGLHIHRYLKDSAEELREEIRTRDPVATGRYRGMDVGIAISQKRQRTGAYRFDPTPKHKKY